MCSSAESATYLTIVPTAKTKHNGSFGTEFRGGGACLGTVGGTTATNSPRTSAATASRATVCIDICFDADGWRVYSTKSSLTHHSEHVSLAVENAWDYIGAAARGFRALGEKRWVHTIPENQSRASCVQRKSRYPHFPYLPGNLLNSRVSTSAS